MLDKQAILGADDLPVTTVDVPEWGGQVGVRCMTGAERDEFEQSVSDASKNGKVNIRGLKGRLVGLTLCDEAGARLFTDAEIADLAKKSGAAIDRLFKAAQKLNHLTDDDVEELAGNSEGGQNG